MVWARPTIRYCEPNLAGLIAQPANAFSSLFISLAGIYIIIRQGHKHSIALGTIAIVLGICSFIYYATNRYIWQLSDLGSMFLVAALMLAVAKKASPAKFMIAGFTLPMIAILMVKTVAGINTGIPIFAALLIYALYLELSANRHTYKYLKIAAVIMLLAIVAWILDYKLIWCSPSSFHYLNGHALWHVLNGLALVALDRHYQANKQ